MIRVIAFIDGFNLYHAIRRLGDNRLKWCDVAALCRAFLLPSETLTETRFYTAYPDHCAEDVRRRHETYRAALMASGVKIVEGNFKRKERVLKIRPMPPVRKLELDYISHEEKETDVNMAVDMLDLAYQDEFDKCLVVSGDSDLKPPIKRLLERFPDKFAALLTPPFQHGDDFRRLAQSTPDERFFVARIKRHHILRHPLPEEIAAADGGVIRCPADYR